jgi:TRAP transporter 4TM/12TM fusion protein
LVSFIIRILSVAFILFQLYTAQFGILPGINQRVVHLGFALTLGFLLYPFRSQPRGKKGPSIADWLIAALASAVTLYALMESATAMGDRAGIVTTWDVIFGAALVLILLEGTRRVMGWALPAIALVFMLYARFGYFLPSFLGHPGYDFDRIIQQLFLSYEGIFGVVLGASSKYIALFILFGAILNKSGGMDFFANLALALFGYVRGGPAKVAVLGSSLFGTISGSAAANVAGTGSVTIPLMKRTGYKPTFAGAVEAAASTGGQIMPPIMGATAFIMAELLGTSYLHVLTAAVFPAVLFYVSIFISVDLEAARTGLVGLKKEDLPRIWSVLARGWMLLVPLFFFILFLAVIHWSTIKSILWTIFVTLLICLLKKESRINLRKALEIVEASVPNIVLVALACAVAGIIVGVFSLTGLGVRISTILITLSGGNLLILLFLTMVASIILGMGLPTIPSYILLAILVAPALIKMGVAPLAAHMFIFYFGVLSNITPPVCIAAYTAAGIAGSNPMKTALTAVKIALAGFILPYIFVFNPSLMLENTSIFPVAVAVFSSLVGFFALGIAVFGYFLRPTSMLVRILSFIAAVLLIHTGGVSDLFGYVLFFLIAGREVMAYHQKKKMGGEYGVDGKTFTRAYRPGRNSGQGGSL